MINCEPEFQIRFAYLVDFFAQLNKLNLQLQESGNLKLQGMSNIFAYEDKIRAFIAIIELWINKAEKKTFLHLIPLTKLLTDKMQTEFFCNGDIKSKKRNRVQLENDLIINVSKITPRFDKLLKNKQTHSSH